MSLGGYLLIVRDHERQNRFSERIANGWEFTDVVLASGWRGTKTVVGFISLDGISIHAACLVIKGRRVVTYQHSIRFKEFVEIEAPISFTEIHTDMDNRVVRFFDSAVENEGGWITPAAWDEFVQVIRRLRPQIGQSLDSLEQVAQLSPLSFQSSLFETIQQEKDAYNLTIRLAGFEPVGLTSVASWRAYRSDSEQPVSFVEAIAPVQDIAPIRIYEDRAIDNDADIFGDWDRVGGYVTGERVFRQNDQALSITNVNRTPIESTLGVDLLYYQHEYKSFVLVQYKRMQHETGGFRYRPDGSYERELKRMKEFNQNYAPDYSAPNEISEYRLSPDAFYFKLHEGETFNPLEKGLSRGMYIPLDYWETFINSPSAQGSRGGINVSYDNIGRYLNNTDFITLVKNGWIGSRGSITGIIEEIVEPLIAAGRSVTIGVKTKVS